LLLEGISGVLNVNLPVARSKAGMGPIDEKREEIGFVPLFPDILFFGAGDEFRMTGCGVDTSGQLVQIVGREGKGTPITPHRKRQGACGNSAECGAAGGLSTMPWPWAYLQKWAGPG